MKQDHFYHLEYSDYAPHLHCYAHNILADMFFGLLRVGWLVCLMAYQPLQVI